MTSDNVIMSSKLCRAPPYPPWDAGSQNDSFNSVKGLLNEYVFSDFPNNGPPLRLVSRLPVTT